MKIFNNISDIVRDDMVKTISVSDRVSIAAACFSIYAYKELKEQLENIKEFRFIFTSPTFIAEKGKKQNREFYIPKREREQSLYGTEFEIKLRNEMTQKAIAKECADWIRRKAKFKSNTTGENMGGFITVEGQVDDYTYMPINGFTTVDIGCERGNNAYNIVNRFENPVTTEYLKTYEAIWSDKDKLHDVTETVIENIATAYNENSPELIYFITLFNVFSEFLEDISEDVLPNEATGFKNSKIWGMLYDFQKDAALAIINKLEKYSGCILADSVGLGKTFTALAVIKYYENRNKNVLVICPKKLAGNWNTYNDNYINNPIAQDKLRYKVLFHTDLSRTSGKSNGTDLDRLNWGNYDLVVIDESHNFRNGGEFEDEELVENRYGQLVKKVIKAGVKTKVLMLSATPVNNRFNDLKNQLNIAYSSNDVEIDDLLNISTKFDNVFRNAQKVFNSWSKLPPEERTTNNLLKKLDFDFFEVLDCVTIARSRKHIERYYNSQQIGKFPERNKPISLRPKLTDLTGYISYDEIYSQLEKLNLEVYTPSIHIFNSKKEKYEENNGVNESGLTLSGREEGIRRLMRVNLLKRLESSVYSFRLTLNRILNLIEQTISDIDSYNQNRANRIEEYSKNYDYNYSSEDIDLDSSLVDKKVKVDFADIDLTTWRKSLDSDVKILKSLIDGVSKITPEHDTKLQELLGLISQKIDNPINENNKKVLIFSAFADTVNYLYEHVSPIIKEKYGLDTAIVTGSIEGKSTVNNLKNSLNNILTCFSPISKGRDILMPDSKQEIDILIATDCISEGQNLQDCDYVVNYDIHWNPVRIIQRFGRVDRIGSKNQCIQLVNFWPDIDLDEYINLRARVETRMKITVLTSTGDDNLINPEEKGDLEYRKQQLKKLQEEVVDIEEMSSGISIMDLGLNEFRLDLLDYIKKHADIDKKPKGLHSVVPANKDLKSGVIYVLKNRDNGVNIDNQNRIHPFYMVYIGDDGEIICDYLNPKKLLDIMRFLCKGQSEPIKSVYEEFNKETEDGKNMGKLSSLLSDVVASIIKTKEGNEIDSLFQYGGTSALISTISGLDDFELICFLVIR